ncbi:MAG: class I SAM-dependent methyltransferase [Bacilli bacterium]|nr:class I SAM-dependent methyltransferase [Bacilli bacterium]
MKNNDLVVDATIGNGHDTLFLSKLVTKGFIFGFDIQKSAINNTKNLLDCNNINNYQLFLENHQNIANVLDEYKNKISLIVFNLGYLPGGDKMITTNHKSTIKAIKGSLSLLNNKGIILINVYPGHDEGFKEHQALEKYLKELKGYNVNYFYNIDNKEAPYLIEIKKNHS